MEFKNYLLIENKNLFAERAGDILSALQELSDDPKNLNKKQLAINIANQMRKSFLRGNKWPKMEGEVNQIITIAYNILKSCDPKQESKLDLDEVIKSSIVKLQNLINNMKVPVNNLAAPEGKV
jgi:uncharacterized protein (UPF0147 family)